MFVVSNSDTGYSDESMRFTNTVEVDQWIRKHSKNGETYQVRFEEE